MKNVLWSLVFVSVFGSSAFAAGKLVAVADDWMLTSSSQDYQHFAVSSLNWLTADSSNKSILFDKAYYDRQLTGSNLLQSLQSAGYTVTISDPQNWISSDLSSYSAVVWLWAGAGLGSKMRDYANSGGNVMYVGGWSWGASEASILLNSYNISMTDAYVGIGSASVTSFSSHPCVAGVNRLYAMDPSVLSPMSGFAGEIVAKDSRFNYIFAVPEPATLGLLFIGGMMLRRRG
ncbi:MAG: PEP-CTERM sorting domain-containing protein [Phycisphaerae bacterium]|jgi:hypothetical protein